MMTTPLARIGEYLASCDRPSATAAQLLCDRHPADAVAFTIVEPDLSRRELTFAELRDRSARLARGLAQLGVGRGDRMATLMGKSADLPVALLAIWRLGAVQVPLFTAFAPGAIAARIVGNRTKVVIADGDQRHKLVPGPEIPTDSGWRIVTTGIAEGDDVAFNDLVSAAPLDTPVALGGDGTLVELYTSGTTGPPKCVSVPLRAIASMQMYQEYGLNHQPADVFWNAADPGWAYGLYYAVIAPLALGRPSVLLRGGFSPETTWSVLSELRVTNFAAGPTVYRALRNAGLPARASFALRQCSSAGEPLPPDVIDWTEKSLGVPILDHYGQTELGMAAGNGWHPDLLAEIRPGSMGRALPGWQLDVLRHDADEIAPAGDQGRLAVDVLNSRLNWFTGYRNDPERSGERFTSDGRWYLTGDAASKDGDGRLFFAARDDDVILMAGYRIGPFDVESVLLKHSAVAEAAVVGVPDEVRGEILAAFIVLRAGTSPSESLTSELQQLVKTRYAAHAYPRRIDFVSSLPKTPSGKVQRYLLRKRRRVAADS